MLVTFLSLPFHAILGLSIMLQTSLIAGDYYRGLGRPWGPSLSADQYAGGGVLWASGDLVGLLFFGTLFFQWQRAEGRTAAREDRRLDRAERASAVVPDAEVLPVRPSAWDDQAVVGGRRRPARRPRQAGELGQPPRLTAKWRRLRRVLRRAAQSAAPPAPSSAKWRGLRRFLRRGAQSAAACGQRKQAIGDPATLLSCPNASRSLPRTTGVSSLARKHCAATTRRARCACTWPAGFWSVLRHGILVDSQQLSEATSKERAVIDVAAARLTLWQPSVGSHVSAGLAYGLPLPSGPQPVSLISDAPHKRGTARQPIIVRGALLPAEHCESMAGVLMTSPARTAADLAIVLPLQDAVAAIDALMHRRLATKADIIAAAEDAMTLASVMLVLAQTDERAESPLESISRVVLHLLGIEAPELQHEIHDASGKFIARVDFWWARYRVAGEADGLLKYDLDSSALRREKLRQEAIENAGIRVVRWTWDEITKTPQVVVARLMQAFHSPR